VVTAVCAGSQGTNRRNPEGRKGLPALGAGLPTPPTRPTGGLSLPPPALRALHSSMERYRFHVEQDHEWAWLFSRSEPLPGRLVVWRGPEGGIYQPGDCRDSHRVGIQGKRAIQGHSSFWPGHYSILDSGPDSPPSGGQRRGMKLTIGSRPHQ
jgi:hypothetical protein